MTEPTQSDARKVLGAHGHGFQYAVLRRANELSAQTSWVFEVAEFPVGGLQNTIHIDFVLKARHGANIYLVAECKRADPARANWCFVKAPYTRRNDFEKELVFQEVGYRPANFVFAKPRTHNASLDNCHLGFELRTSRQGEGTSGGGAAIREATTQVLRAMNGLIDHLFPGARTNAPGEGSALFLPVIFTTARLWVAEGDLSAADLATGRLPEDWGTLKSVRWLWFSHNQSHALRHQLPPSSIPPDLSSYLHAESTRSIAVVGCEGIDGFLTSDLVSWLR
jgi:hypothetical protein